ncbi:MAG TPA: ATP-binding protein [Candidatus Polarisedimenticolia bacterium]|nr:ATP-binding protein [Candidatus Polarisedimenticolia bacterium]
MTRPRLGVYAVAIVTLVAGLFLRWLLDPWVGDSQPYSTLYAAIALAVWLGGYRPGVVVALLGYAPATWLFVSPRGTLVQDPSRGPLALLLYLVTCAIVIGFGEAMRREGLRADAARREADGHVLRVQETESRFQALADCAPVLIWMSDETGATRLVNAPYREYTGHDGAGPDGGGGPGVWHRLLHPDDREACTSALRGSLRSHAAFRHEARLRGRDGDYRWFELCGRPRFEGSRFLGHVGIGIDVTERREAQAAAARSRLRFEDEMKRADRCKDEFLATLAHELRNPLAPIRNAVQILKVRGAQEAELAWGREVIERQVGQMARLLDDLLDVSRIGRNKFELRLSRVPLRDILQAAVETSRPLIAESRHALEVVLPEVPLYLDADPARLTQVFLNLLNNAARYTQEGGRIRLHCEARGAEVTITVSDTGVGIVPEMLPRIFDMFAQAETGERARPGLGVGLALARSLVELHGGSIEARSAGLQRGSTFVVRLPRAVAAPAPAPRAAEVLRPAFVPAKRSVLVVDDLKDGALSLARLLGHAGHDVHVAFDGDEALAAVEQWRPEVVLLDIGMPRLNGYDVCRRIRHQPWGRDLVMIAVTGWGQEHDRLRSEEAGFERHLVKPVDPAELLVLLDTLPHRQRMAVPPSAPGDGLPPHHHAHA